MTDELTIERTGEIAIVQVRSRLTFGCGLREIMRELAQTGARCVLLDLSDVVDIDSEGLGELVAAHASVTRAGGGTILLNVNRQLEELLRITRIGLVFPTYDAAASIVRSILADRLPEQRRQRSEVYLG